MGSPTKAERKYWDNLVEGVGGCIVCRNLGLDSNYNNYNPYISIHHIDGRTKKGCHGPKKVLPLCGPHHTTGGPGVAIHSYKARWVKNFGSQEDLADQCARILAEEKD